MEDDWNALDINFKTVLCSGAWHWDCTSKKGL